MRARADPLANAPAMHRFGRVPDVDTTMRDMMRDFPWAQPPQQLPGGTMPG
jgi:hypothetical protein